MRYMRRMKTTSEILQERVTQRLKDLNLSARAASLMVTGKPDLVRFIMTRQTVPSGDNLLALALVLKCSASWLVGRSDVMTPDRFDALAIEAHERFQKEKVENPEREKEAFNEARDWLVQQYGLSPLEARESQPIDPPLPRRRDMPKDIPVYGTALGGGCTVLEGEAPSVAIEQTDLNTGEVIDFLRRPPGISRRRKVYGLYVSGGSMEPAFEPGQPIIVDPSRAPAIRDYVVVYLRNGHDHDDAVSRVLVKRLARRSSSFVELEQFNPQSTFRVATKDIAAIHRVLSLSDIIGI